jgi:hypothetical protein
MGTIFCYRVISRRLVRRGEMREIPDCVRSAAELGREIPFVDGVPLVAEAVLGR